MLDTLLRTSPTALNLAMLATGVSLLAGCTMLSADLQRAPDAVSIAATAPESQAPAADDNARPAGWTEASHSNKVDPNYDVVFPIDAVNTITINLAPDDWAAMQADMEEMYGAERDQVKAFADMTEEERVAYLQQQLADMVAAGEAAQGPEFTLRSPIWVPATISFQGQEWTHVGVRYKGASSLSPWKEGEMKLPFKFDFDEFEDDYPAIKNQRFFGFKELSLANNYEDPSGMRDTLVYEILDEAGLPSVRTAPVEIVLDYGEGPLRLGLYTMIEVVDETGIPPLLRQRRRQHLRSERTWRQSGEAGRGSTGGELRKEESQGRGGLERHPRALRRPPRRDTDKRPCGLARRPGSNLRRRRLPGVAGHRRSRGSW